MDHHTKVNPAVNQGKSPAVSDNTCVTNSDSHGAAKLHFSGTEGNFIDTYINN